ncbi:hypothetical protein ACMYSQ_008832 [Aspergillus niger]
MRSWDVAFCVWHSHINERGKDAIEEHRHKTRNRVAMLSWNGYAKISQGLVVHLELPLNSLSHRKVLLLGTRPSTELCSTPQWMENFRRPPETRKPDKSRPRSVNPAAADHGRVEPTVTSINSRIDVHMAGYCSVVMDSRQLSPQMSDSHLPTMSMDALVCYRGKALYQKALGRADSSAMAVKSRCAISATTHDP